MARKFVFLSGALSIAALVLWTFHVAEPAPTVSSAVVRSPAVEDREVENLAAFARVYGYVRFFHPSDEAAQVDWDKVGILGAQTVRGAIDRDSLRQGLLEVFRPIAPSLQLINADRSSGSTLPTVTGERLIFWRYFGINLRRDSKSPYDQRRVIADRARALLYDFDLNQDGEPQPLYKDIPADPELRPQSLLAEKAIAPGIILQLPLAVPVNAEGKTADGESTQFKELLTRLAEIDPAALTPRDWRLRADGVITVWNVFQHFHPYLDTIGVRWDEVLKPVLRRALRDQTAEDYYATLSELVARTQDGHGYVYGRPGGSGGIPIRVAVIEDQLVVTGTGDGVPFRKGDIIRSIDGISARAVLRERERYASGSPHLRQFRALNQFGEGAVGSVAHLVIFRDGAEQSVEYNRIADRRKYFFNPIAEFDFPSVAEVRPGIYYVNINSADLAEYGQKLPLLARAKGVIFDWRWDGRNAGMPRNQRILPSAQIVPHLIADQVYASPMLIPRITMPDRIGWGYRDATWPVAPKEPRFKGRVVFIDDPSVVSYGETCMAIISDYGLAKLVGSPTAGCNGNVSFIPLPGGFRVMWTGMDVRRHDYSSFYTVGIGPDFPVHRTIGAVKEERDEYLEKAIEVVEQSTGRTSTSSDTSP